MEEFLKELGKEEYLPLFEKEKIDLDLLLDSTEEELKDTLTELPLPCGIRLRILKKLKTLKSSENEASAQNNAVRSTTNEVANAKDLTFDNTENEASAQYNAGRSTTNEGGNSFDNTVSTCTNEADNIDVKEIRIVVLGITGCGKSATGNTILGCSAFKSSLSKTSITQTCTRKSAIRYNHKITIIDTPGIFDTKESNDKVQEELSRCIGLSTPGPHVFLFVMDCTKRFTLEEQQTVEKLERQFGENIFKYFVIVFSRRDELDRNKTDIWDLINESPPSLIAFIRKCGGRVYTLNNVDKSTKAEKQSEELLYGILGMVKDNNGECYTDEIYKKAEEKLQKFKEEEERKDAEKREMEIKALRDEIEKKYKERIIQEENKLTDQKRVLDDLYRSQQEKEEQVASLIKQIESLEKNSENGNEKLQNTITELHEELNEVKSKSKQQNRIIEELAEQNVKSTTEYLNLVQKLQQEMEESQVDFEKRKHEAYLENARLQVENSKAFYNSMVQLAQVGIAGILLL